MIRCRITLSNGREKWLLISQVEHARLAGELAKTWGQAASFPPPLQPVICSQNEQGVLQTVRQQTLSAIFQHDDGWARWEASPHINPENARPTSFDKNKLADTLTIWRDSISKIQNVGPLPTWCVIQHFQNILRSHLAPGVEPTADDWCAEMSQLAALQLSAWQAENPRVHNLPLAQTASIWLRAFDLISLWLCGESPAKGPFITYREGRVEVQLPNKESVSLQVLQDTQGPDALHTIRINSQLPPRQIIVTPWPFLEPEVKLKAFGFLVPIQKYESSEQLAKLRMPYHFCWHLVPQENRTPKQTGST